MRIRCTRVVPRRPPPDRTDDAHGHGTVGTTAFPLTVSESDYWYVSHSRLPTTRAVRVRRVRKRSRLEAGAPECSLRASLHPRRRAGAAQVCKFQASEQEEEAREFSLSKHSGAFKSGSIFQCFPGAMSTELMTSIGKHTPHLAVLDPGIPTYNWRGNERGILQLFFATRAILTP